MGDVGDYWREHREYVREKKAKDRKRIPEFLAALRKAGHVLEQFSDDHYRVDGIFDYWPSTGTWREVNGKRRGHGVYRLIKELKNVSAKAKG